MRLSLAGLALPAALAALLPLVHAAGEKPFLEVWHGDMQRVGHLGDAQDDFNLMGRVGPWREVDTLEWRTGSRQYGTPVSFRAFRRLVSDGDFNVDVPIGILRPGENVVKLTARFRDDRWWSAA
jgi:hypothetical protein